MIHIVFRGSSVVEQATVNRLVVGSIPTRGAIKEMALFPEGLFFYLASARVGIEPYGSRFLEL